MEESQGHGGSRQKHAAAAALRQTYRVLGALRLRIICRLEFTIYSKPETLKSRLHPSSMWGDLPSHGPKARNPQPAPWRNPRRLLKLNTPDPKMVKHPLFMQLHEAFRVGPWPGSTLTCPSLSALASPL